MIIWERFYFQLMLKLVLIKAFRLRRVMLQSAMHNKSMLRDDNGLIIHYKMLSLSVGSPFTCATDRQGQPDLRL